MPPAPPEPEAPSVSSASRASSATIVGVKTRTGGDIISAGRLRRRIERDRERDVRAADIVARKNTKYARALSGGRRLEGEQIEPNGYGTGVRMHPVDQGRHKNV